MIPIENQLLLVATVQNYTKVNHNFTYKDDIIKNIQPNYNKLVIEINPSKGSLNWCCNAKLGKSRPLLIQCCSEKLHSTMQFQTSATSWLHFLHPKMQLQRDSVYSEGRWRMGRERIKWWTLWNVFVVHASWCFCGSWCFCSCLVKFSVCLSYVNQIVSTVISNNNGAESSRNKSNKQ